MEDKMIIEAEIIDQPYSGQYEERIYDIKTTGKSNYNGND